MYMLKSADLNKNFFLSKDVDENMKKSMSLLFDMQIEVSRPKTQLAAKPVLSIEEEIQQVTDSIKIDL